MAIRKRAKAAPPRRGAGSVERKPKPAARSGRPAKSDLLEPLLQRDIPDSLARSAIFQKVPPAERARLDRAILMPAKARGSLEAVAAEFKLAETYGISAAALKSYAAKLEQLVRPVVTSQILAGVLGCLPASYRRKLIEGSEVVLISKVLEALRSEKNQLSLAELTKVASILGSLAKKRAAPAPAAARTGRRDASPPKDGQAATAEPVKLAESVRLLYGLPWPIDGGTGPDGGISPNGSDGNSPTSCVGLDRENSVHVHAEKSLH